MNNELDLEGVGRGRVEVLSIIRPEEPKKTARNLSVSPVALARFEPSSSRVQILSVSGVATCSVFKGSSVHISADNF